MESVDLTKAKTDCEVPINEPSITKMGNPKNESDAFDPKTYEWALNEEELEAMDRAIRKTDLNRKPEKILRKLTKTEENQLALFKFFHDNPITAEEKQMHYLDVYKLIKVHYDKCRKHQELACRNTLIFRNLKACHLLGKELKRLTTIEDATVAVESLICEYDLCIFQERNGGKTEWRHKRVMDTFSIAALNPKVPIPQDISMETSADLRTKDECVEELVMFFLRAEELGQDVQSCQEKCKKVAKSSDGSKPKSSNAPLVDLDPEILDHRMNFILELKRLIRMALLLFTRMSKTWYKAALKLPKKIRSDIREKLKKSADYVSSDEDPIGSISSSDEDKSVPSDNELEDESSAAPEHGNVDPVDVTEASVVPQEASDNN